MTWPAAYTGHRRRREPRAAAAVPLAMTISSRIRPGVATLVVAGALALAAAGCGSSGKTTTTGNGGHSPSTTAKTAGAGPSTTAKSSGYGY